MRGLHIVLKGMSDTFEHLLPFTLASLGWWLGIISILFGPGATQMLFRITDPRIISELDRPGIRAAFWNPRKHYGRAWGLTLIVMVPIIVLIANLSWSNQNWIILVPIWVILLISFSVTGLMAFSIVSLFKNSAVEAIRMAAVLALGRPSCTIPLLIALVPVLIICIGLVVPSFLLLPALLAAIFNRLVLDGLGIEVFDPLVPSEERRIEESKERAKRRFGP
jgi:uncharacterized membrane protein YesL